MKRSTAGLVIVIIVGLGLICLALAGPSMSSAPSPSPSASPSPRVDPQPASAATVHWAMQWQRDARRARSDLSRVRDCFGAHAPVLVGSAPLRGATAETWERAGERWKGLCRDWRVKVRDGLHRMRCPGGTSNGTRWIPLARWVGWPCGTLDYLAYIIMRESSGRPTAVNPSSGRAGVDSPMSSVPSS